MNICAESYNLTRIYNLLMRMEDVDEENVLFVGKSIYDSTNCVMAIWRSNKLPFKKRNITFTLYL